ncbi:MAG: hypothetical protein A2Y20_04870 [Firmicutes bacterium GWF2_51_9]|nr:MAG: hypothetical protein A2Y20_04870 [Firmicutes bacterium GWF2_51_9]OGS57415.1 MAG: hypothetical protein A2Y19_02825 [Firmicutes bacterium GWE2_51_13]HAM63156.1 hypothetical protein [Erysipelotrichaceae bacterium]HBZ41534.1 hypothetical protein [Erysipelotrichaceae bacterium]
MSWPLFKANIRANRFIWILMFLIFVMYIGIMISMFDPDQVESMKAMMEMLPEAFVKMLQFDTFGTTLVGFIAGSLYGFLVYLFPVVLSVVVNHRVIASLVDKGSMTYLLASPNSRIKIASTQALFSILSITLYFTCVTIAGLLFSELMYPGELDLLVWVQLNLYAILNFLAIGSIGFCVSALSNESKLSLGLGIGIPVTFMILQMLGNADDRLAWIGNLSMYALFDPIKLVNGDSFVIFGSILFVIIAVILYSAGIIIFNKKNMYV